MELHQVNKEIIKRGYYYQDKKMEDKRDVLYKNLMNSGKVSEREIGTIQQFKSAIKDEQTARQFHNNLLGAGFTNKEIGSANDFYASVSSDFGASSQNDINSNAGSVSKQVIDEYDASVANIPAVSPQRRPSLREQVDKPQFPTLEELPWMNAKDRNDASYYADDSKKRIETSFKEGGFEPFSHRKEDARVNEQYTPKKVANESDIIENARNRFALTERSGKLNEELSNLQKEKTDKYLGEFKKSKEYQEIVSRPVRTPEEAAASNKEINDLFTQRYGETVDKELQPYYNAYRDEVFSRYGVDMKGDFTKLGKKNTSNQVADLSKEVKSMLDKQHDSLKQYGGSGGNAMNALMGSTQYNQATGEQRGEIGALESAQRLLENSQEIINEAGKKGNTNFVEGLGRGLRDNFDADKWTMGLAEMADAKYLNNALEKSERGEPLTPVEEKLLESSTINMVTQAYFSGDLGRGYKAGQVTAESLPFMMEFIVNPISGSGNVIAKGLLKYGLKKFGSVAASKGAKIAGRLIGNSAAALGMEGTTGVGHVAAGTLDRLNQNYKTSFDDNGEVQVDKVGNMGVGEAFARSGASKFFENQSEMIFNAFRGGGKTAKEAVASVAPGMSEKTVNKLLEFYDKIRNNKTLQSVADRTQFHGILEEYGEEVYNNISNVAIGEMNVDEVTNIDNNIDTFLGLAPTSLAFATLGIGGLAHENIVAKNKLRKFIGELNGDSRVLFDELWGEIEKGNNDIAKAFVKRTLADKSLTPEQKKARVFTVRDMINARDTEQSVNEADNMEDATTAVEETAPSIDKVNVYRNYKRAERKINSLVPANIIPQLDGVMDVEQFAHDNNLNDNQAMAVADYLSAKQPYNQYEEQTNQRREEAKVLAREQATAEMEKKTNQDTGFVVQAKMFRNDKPVYLTGGKLVFGDDGILDKERSTERVYYFDENKNTSIPAAPDKFDALISINSPEEIIAQAETDAELGYETTEKESLSSPDIPAPKKDEFVVVDGVTYVIEGPDSDNPMSSFQIAEVDENGEVNSKGRVDVLSVDDYYAAKEAELWPKNETVPETEDAQEKKVLDDGRLIIPLASSESEVAYNVIDRNGNTLDSGSMSLDDFNALQPFVEEREEELNDDGTLPLPVENVVPENTLQNESIPQNEEGKVLDTESPTEEISTIPSDDKGNLLYHKAPVEATIDSLYREELEPDEMDSFVQANKDASSKLLSSLEGKTPKMGTNIAKYKADKLAWQERLSDAKAQVDYWNSVGEEIAASRVQPGDKTAEAITSMVEPMSGEELAATMLGTGRLPVLFDSYKKETGGRNAEARGMVGLFASKANGGMTIEEAGEQLMLADQENGTNFFDPNDPNAGRNAIIDVLSGARTRGDLFSYIKSNREAMAERERQAEYDAYSSWTESNFGMKPEDYEAYEEQASSSIAERFKDFDEEEFYNNIINEFDEKQGEITGATASSEVLQGEGIVSPERTGASENEGGSIPVSAESGSEEGTVSEEAPVANQNSEVESSDENGNPFAKTKDNNVDFGYLTSETGLSEAPIRLVDGTTSYGKQHIEQNHGSQIRRAGFETVEDFVSHVSSNYNVVRLGNKYFDKNTYILEVADKNNKTLFIELSSDGTYWNVNSAGVFRKGYSKNEEVIWTAPALGHNSTTENKEVASSITGNEGSTGSTSGDSSQITSSESKDSEVSDNKQEKRKFVAPELSQGEDILNYAGRISEAKQLFDAEQEVDLSPTEAQKEAGNYKKGHVKIDGYEITIENPKGSERSGVDANGQPWSVTMNNSYGYIRRTEGVDGDHIDIFLSDNPSFGNVFVVDQMNEDGSFDEHKVMYGFSSANEAKEAYLANYSPGWKGLGTITEVSKEGFKKWVDSSKRKTKAFAEYKSVADNENYLRFELSDDDASIAEKKLSSDYKRVMNLANVFEEKYLGAGRSFVIKSNDTLRKQLEAIGAPESAIADIENTVLSGKGLACYEPNTDRTIIFDTSASDEVINGYLWHENTHRTLDSVFGTEKEERINSVYEYIEPTHKPQFEVIRNSYNDRSEIEKKEECITYYFEDFFVRKGEKELEKIIDEASPIMKDFFKPIFNKIVYGREEGSHVDGSGRIDEISGKESSGMVLNSLLTESGEEKEGRRGKEESGRTNPSEAGGVRFREGVSDGTQEAYEKAINTKGKGGKAHLSVYNFQEAFQDEMLSVKILQEIIEKHSGEKLKGFENAYLAENRLGSTNLQQRNKFIEEFYEPLMKIVDDLMKKGISEKEIKKYLIAKSGLERNREFAVRDGIAAIENDSDKKSAQKLRKQYEDSRNILRKQYAEGELGWDEYQDKLDELAALYTNKFVDYSGLTAITNDKTHFTDIAKDIVREFEAKQNTDALWSSINAATKFALKKSYDSGITSKEAYNHVSNMFEYYIPMRGWSKETAEDVYDYINQDRGTFSATIKKAEGHLHESQDPFAIIGNMAESAILQGNRNLMKQKFMNMVINHPSDVAKLSRVWFKESGDKWEASFPDIANDATADEVAQAIEVHEKEMLDLQKDGKAECRSSKLDINYHITPKNISQHAVVVKRAGKDYVVYINGNPRAAEALNGKLKMGEQDVLWSFYDYLKRMYAAGMTSYNVNFVGANVSRDIQHAFFITYIDKGIGAAAKLAKNGPKALRTVHRGVSGKLDLHKKEDVYFKEFLENGGETGYSNLNSIEEWKADNDKRLARLKGSAKGTGYAKAGLSHLNDWFEFANRIAENSTRFNAYMLARESGKGVGEAINDAKNITVNFNKKGSSQTPGFFGAAANIFRRWMLFANPIIQGMYQVYHVSKQHKARAASAFAFHTALGIAVPVLNTFLVGMYGDDDDDYFNQNDFTRRNNLMLYIPRAGYLKIPLAPIFRNMYAMGDILYMKMNGLSTTEDMFFDSVKEARALFSLEGQSGQKEWSPARFLLPDLVGPILDVAENENFAGSPIYKDTEFNKLDPEFKKIYKDAWAPLVELSRVMNTVAGGNDYRKSDIGKWANPAAMQHLITNYTGGVGQLIGDVSSAFSDAITGDFVENFDMMKVPVAKRFFTIPNERTSGTAIRREYFKIKDEMDVLNHEIKERAKNAGGDLKLLNKLSELQNSEEYDMLLNFKKESKKITKEESPEKKVERMKKVIEWYNEKKKK